MARYEVRMEFGEEIVKVDQNNNYPKSQFLISAVYKSTLLENRVLAVALSQIESAYEDKEGSLIVELDTNALKQEFKVKGNSIYENLEKASRKLVGGRTIGFSDPENNRFEYVPLLTKASYENGVFSLRFAPEMKKYLKDLKGNFTMLSLPTMLSFDSVYSFRLYEILKSKAYAPKGKYVTEDTKYLIEMSVSELKLELGVVNGELSKVKAELLANKSGTPDYDKAVEKAEEKMYTRFSRFKSECIDKAVNEINEKTEMKVEYSPVRTGRGGKTTSIKFIVSFNNKKPEAEVIDKPVNEDDFIDAIKDVLTVKLKTAEARTIAREANFDMDLIIKADDYIKSLKKQPDNYAAYMVTTIRKRYFDPTYDKSKSSRKKDEVVDDIIDSEVLDKNDILNAMCE